MTGLIILAAAMVLAFAGVYVSWRAGRLDRLHARVETAQAALDAALVRRSSVALEFAASGLLDPAASLVLGQAAHDARAAVTARELPESDLTRALRAVFSLPELRDALAARDGAAELLAELESSAHQVFLARRFYNGAVSATQAARRRGLVRLFRLAGGASIPEFFEIDDSLAPAGMDDQGRDMPHLAG